MFGLGKFFSKSSLCNGMKEPSQTTPTVADDVSGFSESVKANLKENIRLLGDIDSKNFEDVYLAAVHSISNNGGSNLHRFATELSDIDGMTKTQAIQIARTLSNKTASLISRERQLDLGIEYSVWRYAGAPCMTNPSSPCESDIERDTAHCKANGKRYEIRKGLTINGKQTWPGSEDGCKCTSRPVLPF